MPHTWNPKNELNPKWKGEIISKEKLSDLYLNKMLSIKKISDMVKISRRPITTRLKLYGIPTRSFKEALKLRELKGIPHPNTRKQLTKETEELFKSGSPITHLAKKFNICSQTLRNLLREKGYDTSKNIMNTDRRPEAFFSKELNHYIRSGWEEQICKILKENNISYEYEPLTFHLSGHKYIPDIKIGSFIIEIKGLRKDDDSIKKFLEASFKYPEYKFLLLSRKKELENMDFIGKFSIWNGQHTDKKEVERFLNEIHKD